MRMCTSTSALSPAMRAQSATYGGRAAAFGGTTTLHRFRAAARRRAAWSGRSRTSKREIAADRPDVDYALHAMITGKTSFEVLDEIPEAISGGDRVVQDVHDLLGRLGHRLAVQRRRPHLGRDAADREARRHGNGPLRGRLHHRLLRPQALPRGPRAGAPHPRGAAEPLRGGGDHAHAAARAAQRIRRSTSCTSRASRGWRRSPRRAASGCRSMASCCTTTSPSATRTTPSRTA